MSQTNSNPCVESEPQHYVFTMRYKRSENRENELLGRITRLLAKQFDGPVTWKPEKDFNGLEHIKQAYRFELFVIPGEPLHLFDIKLKERDKRGIFDVYSYPSKEVPDVGKQLSAYIDSKQAEKLIDKFNASIMKSGWNAITIKDKIKHKWDFWPIHTKVTYLIQYDPRCTDIKSVKALYPTLPKLPFEELINPLTITANHSDSLQDLVKETTE